MATETEKLYETETGAGTGTTETTAPATTTATDTATDATVTGTEAATVSTPAGTSPYVTGNASLDNYNTSRFTALNQLYDANRDAALGQLEAAHNRTMSDAKAAYDKISPKYQQSRNEVGAEYERQRRNNNIQAAANGLNTGAGSQMQLASSNVYQTNQAGLQKAENEALAEAERQQLTLKEQYEADVSNALANNDAQRAAALLNEYGDQYDRMMDEAKMLAAYGDFSLYTNLYGADAAATMEKTWMLQNPDLAFTLGKITRDEYFNMTGKWPHEIGGGGGGSSGGSSKSSGYTYYGNSGSSGNNNNNGKKEDFYAGSKVPGVSQADYDAAIKAGYTRSEIEAAAKEAGLTSSASSTKKSSSGSSSNTSKSSTTHTTSSGTTKGGSGGTVPAKTSIVTKATNAIKNLLK